ncbi:MAG: alginate export family protein [Methylophagaceae bacterium]
MIKKTLLLTAIACSSSLPSYAENNDTLKAFFVDDAKVSLAFRYRLENVDQDGLPENATASTLRSTLNYKTGSLNDFSATLEFQDVSLIGDDDFNDTQNGKITHPTVADPSNTEVNQAFVTYSGLPNTDISVGRQHFNFDNIRFVNTNNWRQLHQTYDAVSVVNKSLPDTVIKYVYTYHLNRSVGGDHALGDINTDLHLFNAKYSGWEYGAFTAYSYVLDFDKVAFQGNSSRTYGLRFQGKAPIREGLNVLYTADYATQSDHADNPANFDADYILGELGLGGSNWSVKLGYEELEADGTKGRFTAPLGTGHGFHGWADKFVSVPATGIEDTHLKASYKIESDNVLNGVKIDFRYHDFDANEGNADYGDEIDVKISKKFKDHYSATFIYADYNADDFATDTRKWWIILGAKF